MSRLSLGSWMANLLKMVARGLGMIVSIVGVGLLMLSLSGYFHQKVTPHVEASSRELPQGAQVLRIQLTRRPRFEMAMGTIKPIHEVSVASKLLAKVLEVKVTAGQSVDANEQLVRLDDSDLVARLRQAEAAEQVAIANRTRTNSDLERAEQLIKSKAISRADYDAALGAAKASDAEASRARQAIEEARVQLGYANIQSPISGTVVDKRVEAGDTVSPGQVVVSLYDPKKMQMVATVRESLAERLQVGQRLPAKIASLGYECEATVSEIVPEANVRSRSFQVKVTGPCPTGIYSGLFGRLSIPLDDEEVLLVPANSIRYVGQLTMIDVVIDGGVQRRSIRIGRTFGDDVEVLSGLREGESVAISNRRAAKEMN